jgi:hypothetical protein
MKRLLTLRQTLRMERGRKINEGNVGRQLVDPGLGLRWRWRRGRRWVLKMIRKCHMTTMFHIRLQIRHFTTKPSSSLSSTRRPNRDLCVEA